MRKNLLIFAVLVTAVALVAGSFALPAMAAESAAPVTETAEQTGVSVVSEDVSLRGEYEKHFLMSDGSYQAVVYSEPVHELVDGAWVEITSTNQNARDSATTDNTKSNIIDNYVLQGGGVQNKSLDRLYIGNRSAGLTRAYIQFATMPTIPEGSTITSATMTLHLTSGTSTAANASAYMVTGGEWASGTIQWSNMPAANVLLQGDISHNNVTGYTFSCLSAVQTWYNGDPTGQHNNYGIMLKYANESIDDYNAVYSADCTDADKRPSLSIIYEPPTSEINVLEGYTRQLSASGATGTITWASDNTAIATVDSNGVVTGIKAGKATITASVGDIVYHDFTVYVKLPDGVYRIGCANSNFYVGTYGGVLDNTSVHLFLENNTGLDMLHQLWKISYLGGGYYAFRPLYNMNMALHAKSGEVGITTIGDVNSLNSIPVDNRWTIEFASSGYLIKCGGNNGETMRSNAPYPSARVMTEAYSSTNVSFYWRFESVSSVTNQVLLLDTESGELAANTIRYIALGETSTLADIGIRASFVCGYDTDQSITWSTLNPSVVSVNAETGALTGLISGEMATIVAQHTYNGIAYENNYSVCVVQENVPVYSILHYYDMGYNVREGDARAAIQIYNDVVADKFDSIFGLELITSIESYTSICDQCAMDQSGELTSDSLEATCKHSTVCATTESLRNDLFSREPSGTDSTSIVIWSGRKMRDYKGDRSNANLDNHSVVMTTYGIDDWDAMSEFYGTPLDEVAIYEQRIYTLMHELSHLLGAPDHYCYEDNATDDDPCSNPNCDECVYDLDYERKCTMGDPSDFWFVADEYLYCSDCIHIIKAHIEDHHYPLDN